HTPGSPEVGNQLGPLPLDREGAVIVSAEDGPLHQLQAPYLTLGAPNQLKVVGAVDPAGEQSLIGAQVHMAVVLQGRIDQSDLPQFIHIFAEGGMEVDHRDPVVQSQPQVVVHILKKGKYRIVAESLGLVDVVDQTTLCIQVIEAVGYT